MSLARQHRDRILASMHAAADPSVGVAHVPDAVLAASGATSADRAAAQISLRLTHDLRRLKEIKAIERKVDAKREMLPFYMEWVKGVVEADAGGGTGLAKEVLPTVMVWMIDVHEFHGALALAKFLIRHKVEMPSRYQRDVGTIIVEEIAEAALKAQNAGDAFPLHILEAVDDTTEILDMHDEARAKLFKALGTERLRVAEQQVASADIRADLERALADLRRAQSLHARIGVKDRIKRAEKAIAVNLAAFPLPPLDLTDPAPPAGEDGDAPDDKGGDPSSADSTDGADSGADAGATGDAGGAGAE